ncbi:MAG: DUF6266 family protein [Pedobacter sp.]
MAKIRKGILGPVSGTLGPIVGGTWKGIPYIKMISQKKPKSSPGQIAARKKLVFINDFLVPFHSYLTVGFANHAEQRTEISAALSINYYDAFPWKEAEIEVDLSKFSISKGTLPTLNSLRVIHSAEAIDFNWESTSKGHASLSDQVMLVAYCPKLHETFGCIGGATRAQKHWQLVIDTELAGRLVHIYVSVASVNRKFVADSIYWGSLPL